MSAPSNKKWTCPYDRTSSRSSKVAKWLRKNALLSGWKKLWKVKFVESFT